MTTNPTVAGTISLLFALPYLSPGAEEVELSGSNIFTSRVSAADRGFPIFKDSRDEDQIELLSTVLGSETPLELTDEQKFEALISFAEKLLQTTYDLPKDFASVIDAKLPD